MTTYYAGHWRGMATVPTNTLTPEQQAMARKEETQRPRRERAATRVNLANALRSEGMSDDAILREIEREERREQDLRDNAILDLEAGENWT